jgi:hypothetical protein
MEYDGTTLKASTRKGSTLIYDKEELIKMDMDQFFNDYNQNPKFSDKS